MFKVKLLASLFGLCLGYDFPGLAPTCLDVSMLEPGCDSGAVVGAERPPAALPEDTALFRVGLESLAPSKFEGVLPVWAVNESNGMELGLSRETADQLGLNGIHLPQREMGPHEVWGSRIGTYYSPNLRVSVLLQLPNGTRIEGSTPVGDIGSTSLPHPFVSISPSLLRTLELSLATRSEGQKTVRWCHSPLSYILKKLGGFLIQTCEEKEQEKGQNLGDIGPSHPEL